MPQTAASKPEKKKEIQPRACGSRQRGSSIMKNENGTQEKGGGKKTLKRRLEDVMLQRNEKNRPRCHFDLFDFSLGEEGLFD